MGSKQLFLMVLGVFLVIIAIIFGIRLFSISFADQVKDMTILKVNEIGMAANVYRKRPVEQGGGNGSYKGFQNRNNSSLRPNEFIQRTNFTENDNNFEMAFVLKTIGENGKMFRVWAKYDPNGLNRLRIYEPTDEKWVWIFKRL